MVNEPGKLTAAQRALKKEPGAGQFAIPHGEEEENYEQLLDQYVARKFAEGEVMKGTVLKLTDTDVVVDIGYKSEGVIPVAQFIDASGRLTIKVGDVIVIPEGVPHGFSAIPDHVTYLSVRPDLKKVLKRGYVNPALAQK